MVFMCAGPQWTAFCKLAMKPWLVQYGSWREAFEKAYDVGTIEERLEHLEATDAATDTELPWDLFGDVLEAKIRDKQEKDAVKLESKSTRGKKAKPEPKNKKRKVEPAVRSSARQKAAQASVSQSQSDAPAAPL